VRRYLQGDFRGADLRFSAVAQVNDARALAGAAEAIRRIGRSPDATHAAISLEAAARRLIVFAATPLPPPEAEPAETPRRSAATVVRTARDVDYAANRTLAAPVDPTRLLTQTADAAPRPESVPCLAAGRPAHCTPLLEGPLLVTDIVGSLGCTQTGAIGSLVAVGPRGATPRSSVQTTYEIEPIDPGIGQRSPALPPPILDPDAPAELRWVITPPTPGLTGAAFFVSARERLVTVHFDPVLEPEAPPPPAPRGRANPKTPPETEPAPPPPSCQLTWAGFRPRALPSQSFPDSTRPPIENPYR
jgi:hypothetical protein